MYDSYTDNSIHKTRNQKTALDTRKFKEVAALEKIRNTEMDINRARKTTKESIKSQADFRLKQIEES